MLHEINESIVSPEIMYTIQTSGQRICLFFFVFLMADDLVYQEIPEVFHPNKSSIIESLKVEIFFITVQ